MSAAALVERCLYLGVELLCEGGSLAVIERTEVALSDELMAELRENKLEILAMLARAAATPANDQDGVCDLARVLGPLSAAEVAAIPAGSLYKGQPEPAASPARAHESSSASARPAELARHAEVVRVVHAEREPRHRLQPMRDANRVCAACGARGPSEGGMPAPWDWHAVRGRPELVGTCSPACRSKLGFTERRR